MVFWKGPEQGPVASSGFPVAPGMRDLVLLPLTAWGLVWKGEGRCGQCQPQPVAPGVRTALGSSGLINVF